MNEEIPIGPLDRHFAQLMVELNGSPSEELKLAAERVSAQRGQGDICVSIRELGVHGSGGGSIEQKLRATRVVGAPGENKPLILDAQGRLYLQRYWAYERQLADAILARLFSPGPEVDSELLASGLRDFFKADPRTQWQQRAAETAVRKNFCVITGGPGTGKTRTVLIVLMLLHAQFAARGAAPHIALAAPTGKAAARMKESMQATLASLPEAEAFAEHLPSDATTVHRLLGFIPDSPYFRRNAENPLAVDVVIVDEASMVDLALMAKLVDAVPPSARLILLGDKDQLTSVEAGSVLGDICQAGGDSDAAKNASPLNGHIVELKTNFRFGNDSATYKLSRCITEGRSADAFAILRSGAATGIRGETLPSPAALPGALRDPVLEGFGDYLKTKDPREALTRLNHFRILCAMRTGPYGVESLNPIVERILTNERLIAPISKHYPGRPIMILQNDHQLKLYNGDVGIELPDPEANGTLRAFFLTADGALRRFIPARLPPHETVFAMTVHKSQGSEFGRVLFILTDRENRVVTRELLYTGLTRAREGLELWHQEAALRAAIESPTNRSSGLRDALSPTPLPAKVPRYVQQDLF
jgi:exodeoxyribonuclease V alpha subunit